jgi:hypothetical protein
VACLLTHKDKKATNSSGCELGAARKIFLMVVDENGDGAVTEKDRNPTHRKINTEICILWNVRITLIRTIRLSVVTNRTSVEMDSAKTPFFFAFRASHDLRSQT